LNSSSRNNRAAQKVAIAERLRHARQMRNLKVKTLAAKLGVRADSLSQMELGRQTIPAELLVDWCSELKEPLLLIAEGIAGTPWIEGVPPRHARLYRQLPPHHRQLVLDHLELVAQLGGMATAGIAEE